nr:MAG TPA: hypothetical protein [Caudoviricetes sp.]
MKGKLGLQLVTEQRPDLADSVLAGDTFTDLSVEVLGISTG